VAQFDVFANPSESAALGIPYVVVVQSDLLDALATRMVIPLATLKFAGKSPDKLCPLVIVNGQRLRALAHYTAPLPTTQRLFPHAACVNTWAMWQHMPAN
jgi:toxin CcdB